MRFFASNGVEEPALSEAERDLRFHRSLATIIRARKGAMPAEFPYTIILENKYKPLELIEEKLTADAVQPWYNETLCQVNNSVVRLAVVKGEYHWHKHSQEDEFFYVVEGQLHIDVIDPDNPATTQEHPRTISLSPRQGVVIPKDVMHRPRAPQRTVILMVETDTIQPTGS